MEKARIIMKTNGDTLELHFPGEVEFAPGSDATYDFGKRTIDIIAFSGEFQSKKKGKLYHHGGCVILCTGKGSEASYPTFAGVVVHNADESSDHQQGSYSKTWNAKVFEDFNKAVNVRSKEHKEIGIK